MKRRLTILLAAVMLLGLCACGADTPLENPDDNKTTTTTTTTTTTSKPPETPPPPEIDLAPLELLGYYIDDDGFVWIDKNLMPGGEEVNDIITSWEFAPDIFREYFFGTWEDNIKFALPATEIIIDDTENAHNLVMLSSRKIGFNDEKNVLLIILVGPTSGYMWIDINQPDIMYIMDGVWYAADLNTGKTNFSIATRIDTPIGQPDPDFLSVLKLYEIAYEYGIEFDMLTTIEQKINGIEYLRDGWFVQNPVYLVSKSSDKIVLKTKLSYAPWETEQNTPDIDAVYTIEKKDGEWARTVELNHE